MNCKDRIGINVARSENIVLVRCKTNSDNWNSICNGF